MSKFKIGDKVRCIHNGLYSNRLTKMGIYTVLDLHCLGEVDGFYIVDVKICNDDGENDWYASGRFQLASSADKPMAHMFNGESV